MKTISLVALTTIAALSASSALAQDGDWYVRAETGASFKAAVDSKPDVKSDTGWAIDGAVGRSFSDNFRAEAELTYQAGDIKGPARDGRMKTLGGFANGYYDFNPGGEWRPYVGAGIGLARVKVRSAHDQGFAYQLMAGVAHPLSDRLTGEIAYRYMQVTNLKAGSDEDRFDGDYHDNAVMVGLRYKLGA